MGFRTNGRYQHIPRNLLTKYMKANVKDPELVKRLIPNYEVGVYLGQLSCNMLRDFKGLKFMPHALDFTWTYSFHLDLLYTQILLLYKCVYTLFIQFMCRFYAVVTQLQCIQMWVTTTNKKQVWYHLTIPVVIVWIQFTLRQQRRNVTL